MSLSITGGRFKGFALQSPSGKDLTRPTSGKVRQALFNILRDRIDGVNFLDLYAGTGAVGLEALSRGCNHVTLVEQHPAAFRALESNCQLLLSRGAEPGRLEWLKMEASKFCERASSQGRRFGVVFADPPFSRDFSGMLELVSSLLTDDGIGVIQFPTRNPPDFTAEALRTYAYGESSLAFFEAAPLLA